MSEQKTRKEETKNKLSQDYFQVFDCTKIIGDLDRNTFIVIYNKWLTAVKPTISVNWEIAKKAEIIDGDFYLANLLSRENETLIEKLYVLLQKDHYKLGRN